MRRQPLRNLAGAGATQTRNRTVRGLVTTLNEPAGSMPAIPRQVRTASNPSASSPAACSIVGVCHSPAQSPDSPRRWSTKPRASCITIVSHRTVG
ncbi:MAG: hypothetical protein RL005_1876, partial [Planctomycetota bacterium]